MKGFLEICRMASLSAWLLAGEGEVSTTTTPSSQTTNPVFDPPMRGLTLTNTRDETWRNEFFLTVYLDMALFRLRPPIRLRFGWVGMGDDFRARQPIRQSSDHPLEEYLQKTSSLR